MKNKTKHQQKEFFRDWFPVKFKYLAKGGGSKTVEHRFILSEGLTDRFTIVVEKPFKCVGVMKRTVGVLKREKNKWWIVEPVTIIDESFIDESFEDLEIAVRRLWKIARGKV